MKTNPFKGIASWPGGTRPAGWQSHRSWDVLEALKPNRPAREIARQLLEYSLRDLQAAFKLIQRHPEPTTEAVQEKRRQIDLLKTAYVERQVPDVQARNERLVALAAQRVRQSPPVRLAWRSGRPAILVLPLVSNERMTIEARLRELLDLRPQDLRAALRRSRAHATAWGRVDRPILPLSRVAASLREAILTAAIALQAEVLRA